VPRLGDAGLRIWNETKAEVAGALGVGMDVLHVPFGLLLFIAIAALFRRRGHAFVIAFVGVSALQLLNEGLDAIQWRSWTGGISWIEAIEDTALTLALPFLVTAGTAFARRGLKGKSGDASGEEALSGRVPEKTAGTAERR